MTLLKQIGVALLGLIVGGGAVYGGVYTQVENTFRQGIKVGEANQLQIDASGVLNSSASSTHELLKVGQAGTQHTRINSGTCLAVANTNTIAASSSRQFDCAGTANAALVGITYGDKIFMGNASTTALANQGLTIFNAEASSTPGFITVYAFNGTGTTFTWTAAASTSFYYLAVDN